MKKLLLLTAVFAFVGFSNAQEKSKNASSVQVEKKNNMDEWSKDLNLTETQKAQVQQINDDFKGKKQAIRATGTASDFKKLNDDKKAAIDAVLTPEQRSMKELKRQEKDQEKIRKAEMKSQR